MGKYEPLAVSLQDRDKDEWSATFGQIEKVLGFALPPSARRYREWWANQRGQGHSQARGWQDAGWQVWKVDLAGERATFRRVDNLYPPASGTDSESTEKLIEEAGQLLGIRDRGEVVREALRAVIQREAGRRLAALGGTMPDFKAPPRRRFG
ncbi:MAG TPA: type II toxin-antitoxin system VapB family antitoxin [Allosphingosinicella sp.]|nr:type II toxin-antitoxin system VapB family antitoxin [Allosphingosinicella sp.]